MKKAALLFFFILTCLSGLINAQDDKKKKFLKDPADVAVMDSAEFFYQEKNFNIALPLYEKLHVKFPGEQILLFRIGVCELNQPDGLERALEVFKLVKIETYEKEQSRFFYGRVLMMNYKFEEAIAEFEKYKSSKNTTFENKKLAETYIFNCRNGINLMLNPVEVKIENIGNPINTEYSEYVPLINSDGTVMLFTYRGKRSKGGLQRGTSPNSPREGEYGEDIFFSTKDENGNWSKPEPVNGTINTIGNDACIYVSDDGQKFYLFRSLDGDEGSIFMSKLEGTEWAEPEKLYGDINSAWWEGSISLSADGRTAYFSSERPGGFGGKDIYIAHLKEDGSWSDVKNMGDMINTPGDDDAPFMHPSGEFMLFSSTGHNSMGGFDIFRTDLVNDSTWSEPFNIGYPINTPGDDIFYVITGDGLVGYYSSGKAGGIGKQDIYIVTPGLIGKKIMMVRVKGTVTLDDIPVRSEIKVTYTVSGITQGIYSTNSATGKYLVNFPRNRDLVLNYFLPGYTPQTRKLNTTEVENFTETTIDIQFYSDAYLLKLKQLKDSLALLSANDNGLNGNGNKVVIAGADILSKFGDYKLAGLIYHVQIGAYNLPQNFNYGAVLKLGKVEKQKLEDQITRFTIGTFSTLREAYDFKNKVVGAGILDAFVTAEYQGKRYLIAELAARNFFMP